MRRDPARERAFFETAQRVTGAAKFIEHAQQRLELGEAKFGDRWTTMRLSEYVRELSEEAADLAAWAALALQVLDRATPEAARIAYKLARIAHIGALAHGQLEDIDELLGGTIA